MLNLFSSLHPSDTLVLIRENGIMPLSLLDAVMKKPRVLIPTHWPIKLINLLKKRDVLFLSRYVDHTSCLLSSRCI